MAHIPINHHLRPLYRTLAALVGLYSLVIGVGGIANADGTGVFQRDDLPRVLGLPVNPAFAVFSIVIGAVVLVAAVVGRNVHHYVNVATGVTYLGVGLAMMTVQRTEANILGFSLGTCVVWFVLGLITLASGLYGKVGETEHTDARATDQPATGGPGSATSASAEGGTARSTPG